MKLSDLLIPNDFIESAEGMTAYTRAKTKSDAFIELFGVDNDYKGPDTYGTDGHINTPNHVGKKYTKAEIHSLLNQNNIVSAGVLGEIKTELLLHTAFPDRSYVGYKFEKIECPKDEDTHYRLRWTDFVGW
ncbi:MAG: hypothetical protein KAI18_01310 [Candidatus Aenigmarchaeota archaeon]|nr:hypothetical protein [Candidatus Aenigmarchaeota archaeon]